MRSRLRIALMVAVPAISCPAVLPAADVPGNWTLAVGQDAKSYQTIASLAQDSTDAIPDEYARNEVRPQLSFRCVPGAGGGISIRVDWRRFISSFNTEVGFKVDDKALLLVNWGVDKSNEITMPRATADSREVIDYLQGGTALQVEVIPYSGSLVTVNYDISGIDAALDGLREECAR